MKVEDGVGSSTGTTQHMRSVTFSNSCMVTQNQKRRILSTDSKAQDIRTGGLHCQAVGGVQVCLYTLLLPHLRLRMPSHRKQGYSANPWRLETNFCSKQSHRPVIVYNLSAISSFCTAEFLTK